MKATHTRVRPNLDGTWALWIYQPTQEHKWDSITLELGNQRHARQCQKSWHLIHASPLCGAAG